MCKGVKKMFGIVKKIRVLESQIKEKDELLKSLEKYNAVLNDELQTKKIELARAEVKVKEYTTLNDATPEDCKRGPWCKACGFNKELVEYRGRFRDSVYFCGKAESCSNFVQKGE
jgi:hypothetical protein